MEFRLQKSPLTKNKKNKKSQEWHLSMLFLVELNKTNEVKVWLSIYSYFDVTIIMVIIIKKNNLSNFCLVTTQKFKIIKI